MKRYYSLYQSENAANIYIYGDITSYPWSEGDTSSYNLSKELQELEDVDNINIYINSYGGEVKEGLAIYNTLKRHKAKITTIADGFVCSIASVIFAAGDERIVSNTSMLMIHNAWTSVRGDSNDLKKEAEDLEKITQASINAYMSIVNIEEENLKEMMNVDTWINGDEALEMEFATKIVETEELEVATQSIRNKIAQKITKEPEKVLLNQVTISKKDMEEIVARQMKDLESKIEIINSKNGELIGSLEEVGKKLSKKDDNKPGDQEPKNKPLNMIKALFNTKEDE